MEFMEKYHMAEDGDCILAAVSGGADSICLLLLLMEMAKEKDYRVCAVHVEHGLRGEESVRDARFTERFCQSRGIPCKVFHCRAGEYAKENKMTVEEAARELRYGFFDRAAEEFHADRIALAHNRNDCAETVLFHLARGCGLRGLGGIPPVRGKIIRPLLCVTREEIEGYLTGQGQDYCVDRTNEDLDFSRNKIRHRALASLTEVNPRAAYHISQAAMLAAEASEYMEGQAALALTRHASMEPCAVRVSSGLMGEPSVIAHMTLLQALKFLETGGRDFEETHVLALAGLFGRQVGKRLDLPFGISAIRTYEGITLRRGRDEVGNEPWDETPSFARMAPVPVGPEESIPLPSYGFGVRTRLLGEISAIPKNKYTKCFDYDKINGAMELRGRRDGDYLTIDSAGRHKKLSRYLIDEKVPREERDSIPVLADGSHVIWAIGYRISEDVKVTGQTKRVLEVKVRGGRFHE